MVIDDLRTLEDGTSISTDLCIVGSGPAGSTIAEEFAGTGLGVLLLESGGLTEEPETDRLNTIESVGMPRIMDQARLRNRVVGGSSHGWNGRCAPLDEMDFEPRGWVPHSGWPITWRAVAPFFDRAAAYLGIAPAGYDGSLWHRHGDPAIDLNLLRMCFWQYSRDDERPAEPMRFARRLRRVRAPNIRMLHHATVRHIRLNQAGTRVESVLAGAVAGKTLAVYPKVLVLCAGGIETARLLLCSNDVMPAGIGNANGLVGRFLMDHPSCSVAAFDPRDVARVLDRFGRRHLSHAAGRPIYVHGLALSPRAQEQSRLLNCAAWLELDVADDDPFAAADRLLTGRNRRIVADSLTLMSHPVLVARGLCDLAMRRALVRRKFARLLLRCAVEQRPDPESRISLARQTDPLGMFLPRIDWRISDQERDSVAALGRFVVRELARTGLPVPRLTPWIARGRHDEAAFVDFAHPIGATRMADDPTCGVVDANCQVHGVAGLFVAGSSVFPTGGHVNPTQAIVALAIRVADHIKGMESAKSAAVLRRPRPRPSSRVPG